MVARIRAQVGKRTHGIALTVSPPLGWCGIVNEPAVPAIFLRGKDERKFRDDLGCVYPPKGTTVAQGENDETIGYAVPGGRNAAGFPGKRRYEL